MINRFPITSSLAVLSFVLSCKSIPPTAAFGSLVRVDFAKQEGRVSPTLFCTNDQEALRPDTHVVKDEEFHQVMKELRMPMIRLNLGSLNGEFRTRESEGAFLQADKYYMDRTLKRPDRQGHAVLVCLGSQPNWLDIMKKADRDLYVDLSVKFVRWLIRTKHYNVTHLEPFPEIGAADLEENRERSWWEYYNQLAPRIREIAPSMKLGGPGIAWAAFGVIDDFLKHCGDQVDFVSWHRYPTDTNEEPTDSLMSRIGNYGDAIRTIREITRRQVPDRELELCLTEYNMNGNWEPHDPRQATNVGACWMASVLKHAADAGLDSAFHWNAKGDGSFGLVSGQNEKRPVYTLLRLLNHHVAGANRCFSESDSKDVEVLATVRNSEWVVILVNKSSGTCPVHVELNNRPSKSPTKAVCYEISDRHKLYGAAEVSLPENAAGQFIETDMPGYSVSVYISAAGAGS